MEAAVGEGDFPLWLIGDSNPKRWEKSLKTPLDARHPARHNIWTSLLDVMQERVYRSGGLRIDTSSIYIRNALPEAAAKPLPAETLWSSRAEWEVTGFRRLIEVHRPVMLFCFGAFAFEFVRRAAGDNGRHSHGYWGAQRLGEEFRERMRDFEPGQVNVIPLLHRVLTSGKFLEAQELFCGAQGANYFEVVGLALADTMLRYRRQLPIWIESPQQPARMPEWAHIRTTSPLGRGPGG